MDTAKEIVKEIAAHGLSDQDIADKCKCSQPTIWRIKNSETYKASADLYIALHSLREKMRGSKRRAA